MNKEKVANELISIAKSLAGAGNDSKKVAAEKYVGHHHKQGNDWYVDTNFINIVHFVYPGAVMEHMGMGEFVMKTPDGELEFDRMRGRQFDGQVGRSHQIYDNANGNVVKKAIHLMERAGKSEEV